MERSHPGGTGTGRLVSEEDPRVKALLRAMTALASGRFDVPLVPFGEDDDVDRIIEAFASMRDLLATRESSMRQTEQLSVLLADVNSQLATSRKQLARLAEQDPLTELGNRRALLTHLKRRLVAAREGGPHFALLYLDLDGFKQINDVHGHRAGDAVLQAVGAALRDSLRGADVAARLGGDEFAALLEKPRPSALLALGDRILARVNRPVFFDGVELRVAASLGIVVCAGEDESPEELLHRADQAMYAAKAAGGGRSQLEPSHVKSA